MVLGCVVLSWPTGMLVLGLLVSGESQGQPLLVHGLGPPDRSHTVLCSWLPPVLCLEVPGNGDTVNLGQLPLVLNLRLLNKRYRAHEGQLLLDWSL